MIAAPRREAITGLVLCGGRATRMGGVEKALVPWAGRPLLAHVIDRLAPQVGAVALNVNRQAALYAGFGLPLWPDADDTLPGPLAGWLAALGRSPTEWLLSVPCDSPLLPADLAARLAPPLASTVQRAAGSTMQRLAACPASTARPSSGATPVAVCTAAATLPSSASTSRHSSSRPKASRVASQARAISAGARPVLAMVASTKNGPIRLTSALVTTVATISRRSRWRKMASR